MNGLIVQFAMSWESSDRQPLCSRWFTVPREARQAQAVLSGHRRVPGQGRVPVRHAA